MNFTSTKKKHKDFLNKLSWINNISEILGSSKFYKWKFEPFHRYKIYIVLIYNIYCISHIHLVHICVTK